MFKVVVGYDIAGGRCINKRGGTTSWALAGGCCVVVRSPCFFFLVGRGDLAGRAGARPKEMLWARPLDVLGGSRLMWRAARRGLLSWPVVRRMVYVHVCVGPRAERRGGPLR